MEKFHLLWDNRCFFLVVCFVSFFTFFFTYAQKEGKKVLLLLLLFFLKPSSGSVWHRHEHSHNQPECASFWIEMKATHTHTYTHMCAHASNKSTQINRHKHTGKKHKPFGTASLSREGFKAHWHEFMITALCLCQTSTVVVFPLAPSPSFLYALPSPWSELWKLLAGVPQSPWKAMCTYYMCISACVYEYKCVCMCVLIGGAWSGTSFFASFH